MCSLIWLIISKNNVNNFINLSVEVKHKTRLLRIAISKIDIYPMQQKFWTKFQQLKLWSLCHYDRRCTVLKHATTPRKYAVISFTYIVLRLNWFHKGIKTTWYSLQWRLNERHGVSNHQHLDSLFSRCPGENQRRHQSPALLAFVRGIYRWPVDSPTKG